MSNIRLTNTIPVNADFCFLARNPDLFESRRFTSYACLFSFIRASYSAIG
jgi:hypothetical protein